MKSNLPFVSVVVCTLSNTSNITPTIISILASDYPNFELVVVDQSGKIVSEKILAEFEIDKRLRIISTTTRGLCVARNIGLNLAKNDLILYTDDDCRVPANWISVMAEKLEESADISVVFSSVIPGPHDPSAGFIPSYFCKQNRVISSFTQKFFDRGMGASMGIKRPIIQQFNGFDENIPFGDLDISLRSLFHGKSVAVTNETKVLHDGFRTWQEGIALSKRNWSYTGLVVAKFIKQNPARYGHIFLLELFFIISTPLRDLLRRQKPSGAKNLLHFFNGIRTGVNQQMCRKKLMYR